MAVSRIDEAGLNVTQYGNRNLIINGAMQVAQRGTSSSSSGYNTVDRMFLNLSGGTATMSQEEATLGSEVDDQFQYWLKIDTTTGDNYCGLIYKVENVRALKEGKATFSFYAKGTNPNGGNYTVGMQRLPAGSSGSTLDTPLDSTLTITSTWTRYTFTFDVPALANTVTETAGSQLYLFVNQPGGDTSTDAWELNITGMQLEQGETATGFEHRSYGDELQRCLRYYEVFHPGSQTGYLAIGNWWTGGANSQARAVLQYTEKRADPTITATDVICYVSGSGYEYALTESIDDAHSTHALLYGTTTANTTQGHSLQMRVGSSGQIAIDAEL